LDHLVPRLLSNAFEGTLPSFPLAVTEVGVSTGSVGVAPATVKDHVLGAARLLPATSSAAVDIVAVYAVPATKFALGFRVATVLPEPSVTVAGTGAPLLVCTSVKVEAVTLEGFIASLNVATTLEELATPRAPEAGTVDNTVGAVVSGPGATVKDHVLGAANGLPATSVAPVVMVAMYVPPGVKSAEGFRVATVLPELSVTVAGTGAPPLV
jgi:hypothetical protein